MPARPSPPAPSHFPVHHHLRRKVHTPPNPSSTVCKQQKSHWCRGQTITTTSQEIIISAPGWRPRTECARTHPCAPVEDRVRKGQDHGLRRSTKTDIGPRVLLVGTEEGSDGVKSQHPAEPRAPNTADGKSSRKVCSRLLVLSNQSGR